jgi:hypothetical protein
MIAFIKWKLLKLRMGFDNNIRWYDTSSGNKGYYSDQKPRGFWEWLDYNT